MLKIKEFKKLIVALLLVLMVFLSACKGDVNSNSNINSNNSQKGESFEEINKNHIDDDNNGRCDKCNESVLIKLIFLSLTIFTVKFATVIHNRALTS